MPLTRPEPSETAQKPTAQKPAAPAVNDKHAAIVEAATDAFMSGGFGPATMDDIARGAKVSKQTIYHHFGSKEALFGEIVRLRCAELLTPLAQLQSGGKDVRAALTTLARQLLDLSLSPSSLALHRVVIGEAARFPELGRVSYAAGPEVAVEALAGYLRRKTETGELAIKNPKLAAEQFFGMVIWHLQLRALLGAGSASPAELDAAVESAVERFVQCCGAA